MSSSLELLLGNGDSDKGRSEAASDGRDLKEFLKSADDSGDASYIESFLGGDIVAKNLQNEEEESGSSKYGVTTRQTRRSKRAAEVEDALVRPAEDAIDYADFDELADEEEATGYTSKAGSGTDEDDDEDGESVADDVERPVRTRRSSSLSTPVMELDNIMDEGVVKKETADTANEVSAEKMDIDFGAEDSGILDASYTLEDLQAIMDWDETKNLQSPPETIPRTAAAAATGVTEAPDAGVPSLSAQDLARQYFPSFSLFDIPRFSELFEQKGVKLVFAKPQQQLKEVVPTRMTLEIEADDAMKHNFYVRVCIAPHRSERIFRAPTIHQHDEQEETSLAEETGKRSAVEVDLDESKLDFAVDDWESRICYSPPPNKKHQPIYSVSAFRDQNLAEIRWDDNLRSLLEPQSNDQVQKVVINLSDPRILVDHEVVKDRDAALVKYDLRNNPLARYDISNDVAYDALKESLHNRVRNHLSQLAVEHSLVAIRLQSPYYKSQLTKTEARSYHRPFLKVRIGQEMVFSKLRKRIKGASKLKMRDLVQRTKDLSLSDGTTCVLLEYSEEYPCVLSNFGMASKLINYYRKTDAQDANRPKVRLMLDYLSKHKIERHWRNSRSGSN